jgi:hypothetical protein
MATVFINTGFDLLRSDFSYPSWLFSETFSPNLVTITRGGLGAFTNEYSGAFEQAEDGTISGTITGVAGFYYTDALSPETIWPTLQFTINGLSVDFADLYASLQPASDALSPAEYVLPPEELLLGDADLIYSAQREGGYALPDIHGYGGDDKIFGTIAGNDALFGDGGNDTLNGFGGDDTLVGGAGDDFLIATQGVNRFEGGAGDDYIQGDYWFHTQYEEEPGNQNVAVYQGDSSAYTITLLTPYLGGTPTVIDRVSDRDGRDYLSGITTLEFLDQDLDLDFLNITGRSPEAMADLAALYIAYFDRAPDAMGLYYWAAHLQDGMTLAEVSEFFATSPETSQTFPLDGPVGPMVTAVYQNVLNRAPDAKGLTFWADLLEEGTVTRGSFVLEILRGAAAEPTLGESADVTAQREADFGYLEGKTALGLYFATERGMSDVEDANAVFDGFTGSLDSLTAGKAVVDAFYAEASDPSTGDLLIQMTGLIDDPFFV